VNRIWTIVLLAVGWVSVTGCQAIDGQASRDTMYVDGRFLYSAVGEKVIFRGVNEMMVWSSDPTGSWIYSEIAKSRANVVRIVWNLAGDLALLDQSIANCIAHGMIPVVELHDATGKIEWVPKLVDHWSREPMLAIIERHKRWLVLNIANEAGTNETSQARFVQIYLDAIARLRGVGISVPLMIDAKDWGKDELSILESWRTFLAADPLKNVLFSVHTYWIGNQQQRLDSLVTTIVEDQVPLIFGEGPQQLGWDCQTQFPWRSLLDQAQRHEIGWIAWSWGAHDNGDCHPGGFDMTSDGKFGHWENEWGRGLVLDDPHSITTRLNDLHRFWILSLYRAQVLR